MKKLITSFALYLFLISCTKEKIATAPQTTNLIEGSWALVSVSGGFAPTSTLNPDWTTYHFGQNLTVVNNNLSQTVQNDGLESGTYAYNFNANLSACGMNNFYKLSISNFINDLCVKIDDNEMTIDTGLAFDGNLYKFVRKTVVNPPCFSQVHQQIDGFSAPATGQVGQNIQFPIAFTVGNGCGSFGYIDENNSGNIKTLKVFAKYEGCSFCTLALIPTQTNYNFTPIQTGIQIIKIEQPDGTFVTANINIQ